VELLSFQGEVLTDDGGITRRIKVKGEGYNNPNDGSTVHGKVDMLSLYHIHCDLIDCDLGDQYVN
jgi:hypothetical protein